MIRLHVQIKPNSVNSPFWLLLPLLLIHEIRNRTFKSTTAKTAVKSNDMVTKLKRGLALQGANSTFQMLLCLLAIFVPWLIEYSIVMFNLIFFAGWATCWLQFIIFGGLKRQKFAHSAYYKENQIGKSLSKQSENESKSKEKSVHDSVYLTQPQISASEQQLQPQKAQTKEQFEPQHEQQQQFESQQEQKQQQFQPQQEQQQFQPQQEQQQFKSQQEQKQQQFQPQQE